MHVAGVEAGIQPLVALIVGHAVAGVVVHPAVVVAVQGLAHQHKIGLQAVGQAAQLGQKAKVQAVGHVQAQAVDVIVPHPVAHGVEQVIFHVRMLQIQLDQFIAALPRLVPEAVVVVGVAVKADVEPVLVGAVPALFLHIAERPKAAPHVVEHAVQQHADARRMQGGADLLQVVVGAQAAIDLVVIAGVVAVGVALEQGIEQHAGRAQFFDVVHPVQHTQQAVPVGLGLVTIVLQRCPAQAQGVDLVNHSFIVPHVFLLVSFVFFFSL